MTHTCFACRNRFALLALLTSLLRPVEQIGEEISALFDFMQHTYGLFGFEFSLELSTRPEKFLGSIETWNAAETVSLLPVLALLTIPTHYSNLAMLSTNGTQANGTLILGTVHSTVPKLTLLSVTLSVDHSNAQRFNSTFNCQNASI
jgi:threonyl-tRNA synthetase